MSFNLAYHPDNVLDGVEVGSGDGEIVHPSETSTSSQHNHTNAFNVNSTSLYSGSLNEKTSPHSATQISESNIESSLQLASTTPQEADRNVLSEEITNTESLDVTVEQLPETSDEFESLQSLSSRNSVSSNVTNNFTCNSTLSSTLAGIVSEGPPARINRQPTCYDNNMAKVQRFQCLLQSVKQKIYKAQRNLFCDQKKNKEVSLENFVKQGEIFFAGQPALTFFKSLVKMNTKMGESLSWTDEDKMLAMSIYNTNSTVYKILTKVFLLPEIHTFRQINPT